MADGVALEWMAHEMRGSYAVFEDDAITVWCAGLVAFSSGDFITSDVRKLLRWPSLRRSITIIYLAFSRL